MKLLLYMVAGWFCLAGFSATAQTRITSDNLTILTHTEDTLNILSDTMLDAGDEMTRQNACFAFIRTLVRALKVPGSFYFPFDSLPRISILTPENQSFRILTWALRFDDSTYRYYGTIQMNDPRKLSMFPLFDYSHFITHPQDTVTGNEHWYGALYYHLMQVKSSSGKTYYMLFGWDGNDARSNQKVIEVLTFNKHKQPVFGASVFDYGSYDDRNKIKRLILEYKENAQVSIHYDEDMQMIVFDHLQPQSEAAKGDRTQYVPDGTYEGFKWEGNKWHYVANVFTSTQNAPVFPDPVDFGKEKKIYEPKK